jgi:hypothetical protein
METVLDLKKAYSEKLNEEKPVELMRVFFGGKELKNEDVLSTSGIRKNMVVQILIKKTT